MGPERRKQLLLGAVALAFAAALYRTWLTGTPAAPAASSTPASQRATAGKPALAAEAPDVHLDVLEAARPQLGPSERNLFAFKPRTLPPPPAPATVLKPAGALGAAPAPTGPPPAAALPPIAYKFIGIVEPTSPPAKIAVLSDGRNVFQGREGDIIEGRYRILHIGVESIEMAYLDGRGRQTIRLTGS